MNFNYSRQSGFTLVELMVGLTIGMLVAVIILQVLSVFEAQKRTTTGTADAQTNGSIALFNLGRELQLAGYPLMPGTSPALKCTATTYGATTISSISPLSIVDGGVGSDMVSLRYGNTNMGGIPAAITAMAGSVATLDNNFGCNLGDITLITNGTSCALSSAADMVAGSGVTPSSITLADNTAAVVGANLACLGSVWHEITYRVNGGNLERQDGANAAFEPNVAGIVDIQAQYGISAAGLQPTSPNYNQIAQWVDATGAWVNPAIPTDRNRIKAIRIAVVARNAKIEAGNVTAACSSMTTQSPTGLCSWSGTAASPAPAIDLSADANWQRYRYRVFENIIPLRNVIWAKSSL
jgi:type IV pilus assembly protein PilW